MRQEIQEVLEFKNAESLIQIQWWYVGRWKVGKKETTRKMKCDGWRMRQRRDAMDWPVDDEIDEAMGRGQQKMKRKSQ